jgi:hypothetical protein
VGEARGVDHRYRYCCRNNTKFEVLLTASVRATISSPACRMTGLGCPSIASILWAGMIIFSPPRSSRRLTIPPLSPWLSGFAPKSLGAERSRFGTARGERTGISRRQPISGNLYRIEAPCPTARGACSWPGRDVDDALSEFRKRGRGGFRTASGLALICADADRPVRQVALEDVAFEDRWG